MPSPTNPKPGRPHLARDSQQWIFDYIVQETGKVYHWWADGGGKLPSSVRSHAMISKHVGKKAQRLEALADVERAAGHRRTACELYFDAARQYMSAQHPVFETNDEKRYLFAGLERTYDAVRELADYDIVRIEVPWDGVSLTGNLHLLPGNAAAPLLFHVPGCDATCAGWPKPSANPGHERGMHVFAFDGPGQGLSNMRGIPLTADNYERAASAALDVLLERPEIDAARVGVYGTGMGSHWALRMAARDPRITAVATKSTYSDKYYLMDEESPRWKQLFAYLTQAGSEAELDQTMADLTLHGYMEQIACPTLMVTGEYDLRDPLDEVYELFDQLTSPAELWVFADQFHKVKLGSSELVPRLMLDWLEDRLSGRPMERSGASVYLDKNGRGPNDPGVRRQRRWFDA